VNRYPEVMTEDATLEAVCAGMSLARYGDGELKMAMHGSDLKSQRCSKELRHRLGKILLSSGECLVAVPNLHPDSPKIRHWEKHRRFCVMFADRLYGSAFVTRPDSAPWIDRDDYWARLESLWIGRDVTLIRGSRKSLTADDLEGAGEIREIIAPAQHAWHDYDDLLDRIGTPERALICLGATATVMAVDLCAKGVHAVDLGHVGMFLKKHRRGEPMWVSKADKAQALA
jgi:hypothetical protein